MLKLETTANLHMRLAACRNDGIPETAILDEPTLVGSGVKPLACEINTGRHSTSRGLKLHSHFDFCSRAWNSTPAKSLSPDLDKEAVFLCAWD
jgi:hypothetical protein